MGFTSLRCGSQLQILKCNREQIIAKQSELDFDEMRRQREPGTLQTATSNFQAYYFDPLPYAANVRSPNIGGAEIG